MYAQYTKFNAIARNQSATIKVSLIRQFIADPDFAEMLRLAYDNTITFGVKMGHSGGSYTLGGYPLAEGPETPTWGLINAILEKLASRTLKGAHANAALWGVLHNATFETQWLISGILNKDLRIGIGPKTINKAVPKFVPDFSCMLAYKDASRITFPARAELKHNGDRNLAIIENREVLFYSRKGHLIDGHSSVRRELLAMFPDGWVLDGEHMKGVWGEENTDAPMVLYDILPLEAFRTGYYSETYQTRRAGLEKLFYAFGVEPEFLELSTGVECSSMDEVEAYFTKVCDAGGEGIIVKPLSGLYEFKRSHNWVKMKPEETEDVPIVEYVESKTVPGTLGSFLVKFRKKLFKLGAGFTPEQRQTLWDEPHLIGSIVEFKYSGLTPYGIPLCAAFLRFRDDKEVE